LVPIDHDPESIKILKLGKLKLWNKPFLTIFGNEDDIMTGAENVTEINSRRRSKSCNPKRWSFYSRRKGEELAQFIIQF
jgi:hypothetical protein